MFGVNDIQGKSKVISERLRQEILSGKFDSTRKLPSDRMLMRRFAVARATVQAAMKDLLDKHLIDRKPGYGTFLAERADVAAVRKFGVIMPDAYFIRASAVALRLPQRDRAGRSYPRRSVRAGCASGPCGLLSSPRSASVSV